MISTITLNAAIDKTYWLDTFTPYQLNRIGEVIAAPGGKGLNVSKVLHTLGYANIASGIVGGNNGQFIMDALKQLGIEHDFVITQAGESRLCLNMIAQQQSTELLEPGPTMTPIDAQAVQAKVKELASKSRIVAFSGSVPAGLPTSIYQDLIQIAKAEGALTFLDTSGKALQEGILAEPDFIKPNEDEVKALLGEQPAGPDGIDHLKAALQALTARGIACPIITLGAAGSIAAFQSQLYRVHAPMIDAVNPVGCGDSFVAAMCIGFQEQWPIEQCLQYATAVSAANALTKTAGEVYLSDIEALFERVTVESLL